MVASRSGTAGTMAKLLTGAGVDAGPSVDLPAMPARGDAERWAVVAGLLSARTATFSSISFELEDARRAIAGLTTFLTGLVPSLPGVDAVMVRGSRDSSDRKNGQWRHTSRLDADWTRWTRSRRDERTARDDRGFERAA